jgi:hypothetical protein
MKLNVADNPCRRCRWRDKDGLYLCSPCRRVLVSSLDLPHKERQDLRRSLPKSARGDATTLRLVEKAAMEAAEPEPLRCERCDKPRARDSVFCAGCKPSRYAMGPTECRWCRAAATHGDVCAEHWRMYGKRGPQGDG